MIKNKKRTLTLLLGLIIIITSVFSILILLSSYQKYMINSVLAKDNWDTEISGVEYKNYEKIKDNYNLKEISKTYNIGKVNIPSTGVSSIYLDIYSYDENSMKNLLSSNVRAGRLPENSDEIAISESSDSNIINLGNNEYKIGDKINLNNKEYTIVGVLNESKYDEASMLEITHGAITYLEEETLSDESLVDLYISNKNINNVYSTSEKISKDLGISENSISYNEKLLNYSLVSKSSFKESFYLIGITLLLVVAISSVVLIYTTLNILLNSRKKEFGELLSLGCTKKNIRKMIFFEIFILALIAIPISFILSIIIDLVILNNITNLLNNLILQDYSIFVAGASIPLNIYVSAKYIVIALIFIFITICISTLIPAIKISNISPIEAIKEDNKINIKKNIKSKKYFLSRFISNESDIEYKYLRRSSGNTNSIIFSLVICVIVFIVGSNYITNVYARADNDNRNYNYLISLNDNNQYDKVISDLKDRNLIKSYYTEEQVKQIQLDISDNKINEELINFVNSKDGNALFYDLNNPDKLALGCTIFTIKENEEYNNLLNKLGIENLENGECVLLNEINLPQLAKFHVTNYKDGDIISFLDTDLLNGMNPDLRDMLDEKIFSIQKDNEYNYSAVKNIDLKVKKVTDNLYGYFNYSEIIDLYRGPVAILVNKDTLNDIKNELEKQENKFYNRNNIKVTSEVDIYVDSNNTKEIDKYLNENQISGINYEEQNNSNNSKRIIMEVFLYSFLILIGICVFLNIFNVIFSNINLRKKEFESLKSLGMTKKQLNKMLRFEGWYYSILSLIIGIIIGIIIFTIIYIIEYRLNNNLLYNMYISWQSVLICIVFVIISIFLAIFISKNSIKYDNIENIIQEIK